MADKLQERARAIIERPIADLVALGLEGGERAAIRMLAFQYILRLEGHDDLEELMRLRQEISNAIEAIQAEAGGVQ